MKKVLFVSIFILFSIIVLGTKKVPLTDVLPPQSLTLDKTKLYVSNGHNVSIFSLPELKLIKNFGKKGEGPGEFITLDDDMGVILDVQSENICINSRSKISYFSKDGSFIKEIRVKKGYFHKPIGKNFVGLRNTIKDKIVYSTVTLFDEKFNVIKDLYKKKHWFQ